MVGKTGKSDNPVNRIPPEIWKKISENVNSSKDLVHLAKVIPIFAQVIYPKRVEWLFYQVLPLLITNLFGTFKILFRHELLKCRLVCKQWKFGVDNFYENNALHYPASGDNVDWKLERCHYAETFYFGRDDTNGREFQIRKLKKIMDEAANYTNNPFVGRYIKINVPKKDERVDLVERFFRSFGRHIHYLKLHLNVNSSPITDLQVLIRILPHFSNLKGLTIHKFNFAGQENASERSKINMKRNLNKVQKNIISKESLRNRLPKIETLHLNIRDICGDFLSQMILSWFSLEHLKSLSIQRIYVPEQIKFVTPNVLHLYLQLKSNQELKTLLAFNCPLVRKLELDLVQYQELDYDLLCKVLQKFQDRLNHLTLHLPEPVKNWDANNLAADQMTNFFTKVGKLKMPKIKTLTFINQCPLSFNFMCGDGFKSLEHLHLYVDNADPNGSENSPSSSITSSKNVSLLDSLHSENMDILEKLTSIWPDYPDFRDAPDIHNSNVWSTFPRLKTIHIARFDTWEPICRNGWTYRRYL